MFIITVTKVLIANWIGMHVDQIWLQELTGNVLDAKIKLEIAHIHVEEFYIDCIVPMKLHFQISIEILKKDVSTEPISKQPHLSKD